VQEDSHLVRCMVYIDLNMVRAGVVQHPSEWPFCGYNEIQDPPQRYVLIDRERLIFLLGVGSPGRFSETYKGWVEEALGRDGNVRDGKWSESIAVGTKSFVERIKEKLGFKAVGREAVPAGDAFELKETVVAYMGSSMGKMGPLSPDNTYPWRGSWDKSIRWRSPTLVCQCISSLVRQLGLRKDLLVGRAHRARLLRAKAI
jgi:putative transposase